MSKIKTSLGLKAYNQSQPSLLPASLDELIGSNELVRVVNLFVEKIDITS